MFNTLKYAKILQQAGFSQKQSEATIHILVEVMEDKLATKHDLQALAVSTKHDIQELAASTKHDLQELAASTKHDLQELAASTKHDLQELAASTKHDIQQLKSDLIIKMGAMQAAAVGLVVALLKLL